MTRFSVVLFLAAAALSATAHRGYGQPSETWEERYEGPGAGVDSPAGVAVDPDGNVIVAGYSSAGGYASEDYAVIKYSSSGDLLWLWVLDGTGGGTDIPNGLAVDPEGSIYVTGKSWGSGSAYDYLTVKLGSDGDTIWTRRYNGPRNGGDVAHAIAVDEDGDVFVTGESEGSIGTHGIFEDYATVKYSADGALQWVARYNGPAGDYDAAVALALDEAGFVYVTGTSDGGSSGSGASHFDFATIKYDSLGILQWVQRYNGPGSDSDEAADIAVDADGYVYVTGNAYDDLSDMDITTVRYSSAGDPDWIHIFDGPGNDLDEASDLMLMDAGELVVTGRTYAGTANGFDFVTIRYTMTGDTSWVRTYDGGSGGADCGVALADAGSGAVYVTGGSSGGMTGTDYATFKYSASGDPEWEVRYSFGGAAGSEDAPCGIASSEPGIFYVTGMSALDFATVAYTEVTTSASSSGEELPIQNLLLQNYPNPFNPATSIRFITGASSNVRLIVYDVLGREVAVLVDETMAAGGHEAVWDARGVASGTYYYRLVVSPSGSSKGYTGTRSLVVVK